MSALDWEKGCVLPCARALPGGELVTCRYLSQMGEMYLDSQAVRDRLAEGDPLIYSFHELGVPEREGELAFGVSTVYPGKIGAEYYMTKGHFHRQRETAEVYYGLTGSGLLVIENEQGDCRTLPLSPGQAAYVPRGYAHRSVNTGTEPFSFFFVFPAQAGHDYGTVAEKGFRLVVLEREGQPAAVPNPRGAEHR